MGAGQTGLVRQVQGPGLSPRLGANPVVKCAALVQPALVKLVKLALVKLAARHTSGDGPEPVNRDKWMW